MQIVSDNTKKSQAQAEEDRPWPALNPITLPQESSAPYPLDALPTLLQAPIKAYQAYGQQPLALVACSALANVSLACQSLANVGRDKHLISPTSMYFLIVANSGERKSAVDSAFSTAAKRWEAGFRQEREPQIKKALSLHNAWKVERDGVLNQIRRAAVNGEDPAIHKAFLTKLDSQEPVIPVRPTLYFEDATHEALALHLAHGWPSAALWSDEAGIVLGSHSMQSNPTRFVALLNRLWDSKATTIHRKTSASFTIQNRRLTLNLMMQPLLLQKMHSDDGSISRQSGFMARSLLAFPESKMGERFYQEPPESMDSFIDYETHITDCLNQSRNLNQEGCINLTTLFMSESAKRHWIEFFNRIESGLAQNSEWFAIKDFASKAAENAARLAANLHLFQGKEGDIQAESIEQAISIIDWHLHETKRLLLPSEDTTEIKDALKLIEWLQSRGSSLVSSREIQRLSPLRNKEKRNKAINMLIDNCYLREAVVKSKKLLIINPTIR